MPLHRRARAAAQRVLVLGAGEVGVNVAQRLTKENRQVVIVDNKPEKIQAVQNALDVQALVGSAASPAILELAGVAQADIVVAATGSDEVNLLACLIANIKNPESLKLARVKSEEYAATAGLLGPEYLNIKAIINPDVEVVNTVIRMLTLPRAVDYGEFGNGRIKVLAIEVASGPLLDRPLARFQEAAKDPGVRVAGVLRGDRLHLPSARDVIKARDVVYFVCLEESLNTVLAVTEARSKPIRHICVVGGGDIGLRLARILDNRAYRVKLVEKSAARCAVLADRLTNVTVLHGDGTDRDFMRDENVGEMDMVVALTGDEETNILACLLAKSIGTPHTITRVNKHGYMPIVRAIGIKLCVNPRLAATNSIVHFLRHGLLLSTLTTQDEDVEMMEVVMQDSSPLLGKSLREAHFPAGANLLAAKRGEEVFIPRGDTVFRAGDQVILICEHGQLPWIDANLIGRG